MSFKNYLGYSDTKPDAVTDREPVTIRRVKVAWIRNAVPAGQPAPGRFNCPCGHAPESQYGQAEDVTCACGRVYSGTGWILKGEL